METAIKEGQGEKAKDIYQVPQIFSQTSHPSAAMFLKKKMTFTEDTHLSISKGDEQREEKTKEEMQKNVLSIRGEDRRY